MHVRAPNSWDFEHAGARSASIQEILFTQGFHNVSRDPVRARASHASISRDFVHARGPKCCSFRKFVRRRSRTASATGPKCNIFQGSEACIGEPVGSTSLVQNGHSGQILVQMWPTALVRKPVAFAEHILKAEISLSGFCSKRLPANCGFFGGFFFDFPAFFPRKMVRKNPPKNPPQKPNTKIHESY